MIVLYLRKLILFNELLIVLLFDHFSHFFVIQFDPEVHVAKEAFVVVVAFLLRVRQAEVLESVVVDLLYVFQPLVHRLGVDAGCEMNVDERK